MRRFCFPYGFRLASLSERRKFYRDQFDPSSLIEWLGGIEWLFAFDIGSDTGIYDRRFKRFLNKMVYFVVSDSVELKAKMIKYAPEDLYYDRNLYEDHLECYECKKRRGVVSRKESGCFECENMIGQELSFDVDPENVDCPNCGSFDIRRRWLGRYSFCLICFDEARKDTIELYDMMEREYDNVRIVFSGRGFHVHVRDENAARMSFEERRRLARELEDRGFRIDPWVTSGGINLIRAPFSLHGMVSRIVMPIDRDEIDEFDPREERFLPFFIEIKKED